MELFTEFKRNFPDLPIIAEDLGVITPDVENLRDSFALPGMKVLQFAFSGDPEDDFLPHHYPAHCVAYTGTHDNNTARGWYDDAADFEQEFCRDYLNFSEPTQAAWAMIRATWQSAANFSLAPMQDFLGYGTEARFNIPGKMDGNWKWRMRTNDLSADLARSIRKLNLLYSRLSAHEKQAYTNWLAAHAGERVKPH